MFVVSGDKEFKFGR